MVGTSLASAASSPFFAQPWNRPPLRCYATHKKSGKEKGGEGGSSSSKGDGGGGLTYGAEVDDGEVVISPTIEELQEMMQFGETEDTKHYSDEFKEYIRGGVLVPFDGEEPTDDLIAKMTAQLEKDFDVLDLDELDLDDISELGFEVDPTTDGLALQVEAARALALAEGREGGTLDWDDMDEGAHEFNESGEDGDDDDDDDFHPEPWHLKGSAVG
jgi:hypothetical protein